MTHRKLSESEAELEDTFEKAIRARDEGDGERALHLFEEVLSRAPAEDVRLVGSTYGMMGHVCRELLNAPARAETHYRLSTALLPESELASLGLFHSLLDQDRWIDALNEMLRFLERRSSAAYRELFQDGFPYDAFDDDEGRSRINLARPLLARIEELLKQYMENGALRRSRLSDRSWNLLLEVIGKRRADLIPLTLQPELIEELCGVVMDELCETGLRDDDEPNALGVELETVVDELRNYAPESSDRDRFPPRS